MRGCHVAAPALALVVLVLARVAWATSESTGSQPAALGPLLAALGGSHRALATLLARRELGPAVLRRVIPTASRSQLLHADDLDAILARNISVSASEPRSPLVPMDDVSLVRRVTRAGEPWSASLNKGYVALDDLHAGFRAGFTLIVNKLERRWPPLAALAHAARLVFGGHVHTNGYFSPRGSQGFEVHDDPMDVLVLQLAGRKRWCVYEPRLALPRPGQRVKPLAGELVPAGECFTLAAGDVLWLPRGTPHEADTRDSDSSSLHLSLGIDTFDDTWEALAHRALVGEAHDERGNERGNERAHALVEAGGANWADSFWRETVPREAALRCTMADAAHSGAGSASVAVDPARAEERWHAHAARVCERLAHDAPVLAAHALARLALVCANASDLPDGSRAPRDLTSLARWLGTRAQASETDAHAHTDAHAEAARTRACQLAALPPPELEAAAARACAGDAAPLRPANLLVVFRAATVATSATAEAVTARHLCAHWGGSSCGDTSREL